MSSRKRRSSSPVQHRQSNSTRKWRENEVLEILEYFKHVLQKNQQIEKPTAIAFYEKLIKNVTLENVSVIQVKNKVRHLRASYYRAVEWLNRNGQDVSEGLLRDHILEICPFWDLLSEIFGGDQHAIPTFEHYEQIVPSSPMPIPNKRSHSTTPSPAFSEEKMTHSAFIEKIDRTTPTFQQIEDNNMATPKPIQRAYPFKSSSALLESRRRASALEEQNRIESMWKQGQLKLSTDKFEFEKQKQEQDFLERRERNNWEKMIKEKELELKVKEIETNERLRTLEIEKEERIERYRIEQESKLKLELSKLSKLK